MEATAIKYLKGKLEALGYIQQVYGLAEMAEVPGGEKQRFPAVYEAGELQHINFDSYETLSFILRDGKVRRDKKENPYIANANLITEIYQLSIVIYGNGKEDLNCSSYTQSIAMDIARVLENWNKRALEAAGNYEYAEIIVSGIEQNKKAVWDKLTNQDYRLKDTDMLVMVSIEVTVSGEDRCFEGGPCGDDPIYIPPDGGDNAGTKQGDLLYWDVASGMWKRLPAGADGYVLTSNGIEQAPTWQASQGGSDFDCADLAGCTVITTLQSDVNTLQTDLNSLTTHVDDVEQAAIDADAILQANIDNVAGDLTDHVNDTANPHHVNLEQARLQDNYFEGEVDMNGNPLRNLPTPTNADEAVNKAYVDGLIDRVLKQPQAFTPAGSYPTTYNGNAVQANDTFRITAAGVIGGVTVNAEDLLIALVDTPGQTDSNWQVLESNRDQASETVKGVAKIVSQTDIQNELSTNNTDIVTSQKFWLGINRMVQVAWTWAQKQIFTSAPRFSSVNANQYLKSDASKDLTGVDNIPVADVTGAEAVANKDTDGTLAANSDTKYASQKATKTYVDTKAATKADKYYAPHNHSVNTYTLLESDNNTLQRMDYATAIAVTIPNDTNAPTIQIGYVFRFVQLGAGQITLGPDSGVTINNRNGLKTAGQYAVIAIEKTAANTWLCYGDTTT